MLLFSILLIVVFYIIVHEYLIWNYDYWKKRGVIFVKPEILFGNFRASILRKVHMNEEITNIYK